MAGWEVDDRAQYNIFAPAQTLISAGIFFCSENAADLSVLLLFLDVNPAQMIAGTACPLVMQQNKRVCFGKFNST